MSKLEKSKRADCVQKMHEILTGDINSMKILAGMAGGKLVFGIIREKRASHSALRERYDDSFVLEYTM